MVSDWWNRQQLLTVYGKKYLDDESLLNKICELKNILGLKK